MLKFEGIYMANHRQNKIIRLKVNEYFTCGSTNVITDLSKEERKFTSTDIKQLEVLQRGMGICLSR